MTERWSAIDRIVVLGLDETDGHRRETRGPFYTVLQGSGPTHDRLTRLCRCLEDHFVTRTGTPPFLPAGQVIRILREEAERLERAE